MVKPTNNEYRDRLMVRSLRGGTQGALGGVLVLTAFATIPSVAFAGDWTITPRVSIGEDYSDNIRLAPPGRERSDFVTTVTPGVLVSGRGARVTLDLIYDAQFVYYARDTGVDRLNNQLLAVGNVEVLEDRLGVDVRASVGQQNIDNTDRTSIDNINLNSNRETFYSYTVSPVFRQRFSSFGDFEARYVFTQVINDDDDNGDATQQAVTAQFDSGDNYGRFPWSIDFESRRIDNDDEDPDRFSELNGQLGYIVSRQFRVDGRIGYEDNDFDTLRDDTNGMTWRFSGTWTPTARTRLELGFGDRFFGTEYFMRASHRSRRTLLSASYQERPQTASVLVPDQQILDVDEDGNLNSDEIGGNGGANIASLTSDEVFIRRRFQGGVSITGARTETTLSPFYEKRDYEETGDEETVFGVEADIVHNLTPKLSVTLSGGWDRSEFRDGIREDDEWDIGVGVSRRFGRQLTGLLSVRHAERDSNGANNSGDYEENRISATLQMVF